MGTFGAPGLSHKPNWVAGLIYESPSPVLAEWLGNLLGTATFWALEKKMEQQSLDEKD